MVITVRLSKGKVSILMGSPAWDKTSTAFVIASIVHCFFTGLPLVIVFSKCSLSQGVENDGLCHRGHPVARRTLAMRADTANELVNGVVGDAIQGHAQMADLLVHELQHGDAVISGIR